MDSDGSASPMADEQPHPEPVLAEAAESSPYGYTQEVHHILIHLLRLSASRRFPVHRHLRLGHGGYIVVTDWVAGDDAYRNGGFGAVPASEEAVAALPETTVGEGEIKCAVCLEAYGAGDKMRTLPCLHGFHERCIFRWLRLSRLCPLCRFALPAAVVEETESFLGEEDGDNGDGEEEQSAYDL